MENALKAWENFNLKSFQVLKNFLDMVIRVLKITINKRKVNKVINLSFINHDSIIKLDLIKTQRVFQNYNEEFNQIRTKYAGYSHQDLKKFFF